MTEARAMLLTWLLRAVVARKRDENREEHRETEPCRALTRWNREALAGEAVIGP